MEKILGKYFTRPSSSSESVKPAAVSPDKPRRHSADSRPSTGSKSIVSPRKILPIAENPTEDIEEQFLDRKRRLSAIAESSLATNNTATPSPIKPWQQKTSNTLVINHIEETKTPAANATANTTAPATTTLGKIAKFQFLDFSGSKATTNVTVGKVRGDWREETHGGVKMWVNIKTNEVAVKNPFEPEKRKFEENGTFRVKAGPIPKGTAADLYDPSAVSEMFKMLDERRS